MEMQKNFSVEKVIELAEVYRKQVLAGIAAGVIALGGFAYWRHNRMQLEKNSLQALSELLMEYDQAFDNNELWQDIEIGSRTGVRQYSNSDFSAYMLNLEVDALRYQDKFDEALLLMNDVMKNLSKSSPLYYLYAIKAAQIKLASSDKVNQDEGLALLAELAANQKNPQQLQARYYEGLAYEQRGDIAQAEKIWQSLAQLKQDKNTSIWVVLAQQKLQ